MLQCLTLLRWHTRRHSNQLSCLLAKLQSPHLHRIVARCYGGAPNNTELETTDILLSQPPFDALQAVDFVFNSWDNCGGSTLKNSLHAGLPGLAARRLILLEFESKDGSGKLLTLHNVNSLLNLLP